ncbi:hypothetical protein [Tritonibacter horizontis]|uniref:Lipoprotein n=1 Tax=Tritonibacter horizontis TaxID=1768241 RepID=A0A132BW99_9RHOB|nr:hypothetical protein [Tritonibacter horizontis]KUP92476.1 hypothetical protein TRIHO_27810 [Tritonibacter horizontis]
MRLRCFCHATPILAMLSVAACSGGAVDPRFMDMNLSRQGKGYEVTGRYGPGWSEGDVRGEVERACQSKSLSLTRFGGQPYSPTRGTRFTARCGA